jgi:hypothetical protein
MTRDERALLLSVAGAMAEILEAGAAPLDTISDHGREIRTLIDRIQAQEMAGNPIPRPERRPRQNRARQLIARPRTVPDSDWAPP